jgi:hypothetical protein
VYISMSGTATYTALDVLALGAVHDGGPHSVCFLGKLSLSDWGISWGK